MTEQIAYIIERADPKNPGCILPESYGKENRIALEPAVIHALLSYQAGLKAKYSPAPTLG